jgi:mRNA interferase RelE/StbE
VELTLSKDARKFISKLNDKQAKQIAIKIVDLQNSGHMQDSKNLRGNSLDYYRVDVGEFRIIYQIEDSNLLVMLVGKRNDSEVYKQYKRKTQ